MKKVQRFLTIKEKRIIHKEYGIVDFKVILDRKDGNVTYYLTEDGECDSTIYKIDYDFNSNLITSVQPDFFREHYEQLNDYDEKENKLIDDIVDYLNGEKVMTNF